MELSAVHDVHMAINLAHRFVYFVPEAAEEYGRIGATGRGAYFASRVAPLGAVPDPVIVATFYNFSPHAVAGADLPAVWRATTPAALQTARYTAAERALRRVGPVLTDAEIAEARRVIDPVVAGLDLAGKPLAAANAALPLPADPMTALWQQVTVIREWRGDAHIAVLVAEGVGPCECMVLQVGTGRFPMGVTRATRQWTEEQWAAAQQRLAARGWAGPDGSLSPAGLDAREAIEARTDLLCAPLWEGADPAAVAGLTAMLQRIHAAMEAAGTYAALA